MYTYFVLLLHPFVEVGVGPIELVGWCLEHLMDEEGGIVMALLGHLVQGQAVADLGGVLEAVSRTFGDGD